MNSIIMSFLTLAAELEGLADVIRTPSGDGHMVWHCWGNGPPLVLLHGGSGAWNHWLCNIKILSQHYRLIVADMPGLGDSDDLPFTFDWRDYPASVPKLAEIINLGIKTILGHKPFDLCGFSFGSIAGAYVAANAGLQLKSFTLVGSSAFGWSWNGLPQPFQTMTDEMNESDRLAVQRYNLSNAMLIREIGEDLAHMQLYNVDRARVRSHGVTETNVICAGLAETQAPLNGIWGRADVFAQPNLCRIRAFLRTYDAAACFQIIDDAGHWVMLDKPDEFNLCLLEVLERRRL